MSSTAMTCGLARGRRPERDRERTAAGSNLCGLISSHVRGAVRWRV